MAGTIVIDGASSAGCTSLVQRFCERACDEYKAFYIDEFTFSLPEGMWEQCSCTDQGWVEIGMAFNRHIAAADLSGDRIIADVFYKLPEARNHLFDLMGRKNVCYVQAYCSLDVLKKREVARGDRRIGLAERQFRDVYSFTGYNIRLDTGKMDIDTCCSLLLKEIRNHGD